MGDKLRKYERHAFELHVQAMFKQWRSNVSHGGWSSLEIGPRNKHEWTVIDATDRTWP